MGDIITYLITAIIGAWVGSLEWRTRETMHKLAEKPDRKEVNVITDYRLESLKLAERDIQEDLKRVEAKLDKLNDRLTDLVLQDKK
jgi:hypothetical protein